MRGKIRTYQTERGGDNRTNTRRIVRRISYVFALFICSVLCGCTRREQLVLETSNMAQETWYEASGAQDEETSEVREDEASQTQADKIALEDSMQDINPVSEPQEQKAQPDQTTSVIYVHVCGAVKNPGVYELDAGSRVYEAVAEAGGFTELADSSYVNQAQRLSDGAKLIIPTTEQVEAMAESDAAGTIGIVEAMETGQIEAVGDSGKDSGAVPDGSTLSDGKININTASEAELCNIPGIGETRAAAIVAYRQEKGGFTSIEDIMNISGIKQGTYDKIKDRIKVN